MYVLEQILVPEIISDLDAPTLDLNDPVDLMLDVLENDDEEDL